MAHNKLILLHWINSIQNLTEFSLSQIRIVFDTEADCSNLEHMGALKIPSLTSLEIHKKKNKTIQKYWAYWTNDHWCLIMTIKLLSIVTKMKYTHVCAQWLYATPRCKSYSNEWKENVSGSRKRYNNFLFHKW